MADEEQNAGEPNPDEPNPDEPNPDEPNPDEPNPDEENAEEESPIVDLEQLRERVGTTLRDKWTLEKLLGVGGMAAVYAAKHEELGRRDAIKILHPKIAKDERVIKRFRREAKVVQRFKHPGVVEVRDFDVTDDGEPFLVMELLGGASLARRLRKEGPMDVETLLPVAIDILDALVAAHAEGIVHRDVKPSNVMITEDGTVKVLDFGVARWARGKSATLVTAAGTTVGTVAYMPPEQLRSSSVDHRADIYSVGATMVRMLTGEHTHAAADEGELSRAILTEPARPLAERLPNADENLCLVVDRALAHVVGRRYPDARTMQRDLEAVAKGQPPPFAVARADAGDDPQSLEPLDEVHPPTSSTTRPGFRAAGAEPATEPHDPEVDADADTEVMAEAAPEEGGGTVPMQDAIETTLESDAPVPPVEPEEPVAVEEARASPAPEAPSPADSARTEKPFGGSMRWVIAAGALLAGAALVLGRKSGPSLPPPVDLGASPGGPSGTTMPSKGPEAPRLDSPATSPDQPDASPPSGRPAPGPVPPGTPSGLPSTLPSGLPSSLPSGLPSSFPSGVPSSIPTALPSSIPTALPSSIPTALPSGFPSWDPMAPEGSDDEPDEDAEP